MKRVEAVEGIQLSNPNLSDALASGLEQLRALQGLAGGDLAKRAAFLASVHSFNMLLAAAGTVCKLDPFGPDAEIDLVAADSGSLIYRCRHDPSHRWDLAGHQLG
jgi:hypothetical protein